MNLKQANRLVRLAQFLEELPKENWDYTIIRQMSADGKVTATGVQVDCKTCACAFGWCPTVFPNKFKAELDSYTSVEDVLGQTVDLSILVNHNNNWVEFDSGNDYNDDTNEYLGQESARDFFGMSEDEFETTFLAVRVGSTYGVESYDKVTKKMVCDRLYSLVRRAGYTVE